MVKAPGTAVEALDIAVEAPGTAATATFCRQGGAGRTFAAEPGSKTGDLGEATGAIPFAGAAGFPAVAVADPSSPLCSLGGGTLW